MKKTITKEEMALLKEATEMFTETGCVLGIDGEQVPAERIVPGRRSTTRKQSTIRRYGTHLDLHLFCHGWRKNGIKDARSSRIAAVRTPSSI